LLLALSFWFVDGWCVLSEYRCAVYDTLWHKCARALVYCYCATTLLLTQQPTPHNSTQPHLLYVHTRTL